MYQGMDEPKAWQRAAELIALLCKRHGLTIDKVVTHRHWSGMACPSRIRPRMAGARHFPYLVGAAKTVEALGGSGLRRRTMAAVSRMNFRSYEACRCLSNQSSRIIRGTGRKSQSKASSMRGYGRP
jgi:hypothetical protein